MKKYISLIVCTVLLITALVMGSPADTGVSYGRGKGNDAKVTSVGQFVDVLEFFNNYEMASEQAQAENSGYASLPVQKTQYTSATFYNKSRTTEEYHRYNGGSSYTMNSSMDRELTIALTKTSAYYKSVGLVMSNRSVSDGDGSESATYIFDFDMDIYVTAGKCYIKLSKFDMMAVEDGEEQEISPFKSNICGKWVDAGEMAEYLLAINEENYAFLGRMGEYFDSYKAENFNISNGVYTIKENKLKEAFAIIFGATMPEEMKGDFVLNLSNSVRPTVKLTQSYKYSEDDYSLSQTAYSENNIAFFNINNTVVEFTAQNIYDVEEFINEEVVD